MPRVKMQVRSRPIAPKVDVSLDLAESMIVDSLGPKLNNWQPLNNAQITSKLLNQMFGSGWSIAQFYRRQEYWHQGVHYYRFGRSISYNLPTIVQWVLEQQFPERR